MQVRTILVTGGLGLIGHNVVARLKEPDELYWTLKWK